MKKVQAATVVAFKSHVDRMAEFLTSQGYKIQHMHLIEGISRYEGARDWRTYHAALAATPAAPVAEERIGDADLERPVGIMTDSAMRLRHADLEAFDNGIHGELPLSPEEAAEYQALSLLLAQSGPATEEGCLINVCAAGITPAEAAAMSEMLYEWDDELSFADILAILRGTKKEGNVSATSGFTDLTREQLADELENLARERGDVPRPPAGKCTSPVEDHALSCLDYWGSLSYLEILEILDSEDPERRKEIDVHPSLVGFSNSEISENIRREHRWAMRNPRLNPTLDWMLDLQ